MGVAIIGAKTAFASTQARISLEELIYNTVKDVLAENAMSMDDVDLVAIASSDGIDGRAISSMVTGGSVGAYRKSIINSSSAGEHALILGSLQIMAGRSRVCLVANWSKPSEGPGREVDALTLDPMFYRALHLGRAEMIQLQIEAMLATLPVDRRWMQTVGATLGNAEAAPALDGAVALILCDDDIARRRAQPHSKIAGFGWASDTYWRGAKELESLPSLAAAARLAYRMAAVENPQTEIGLIEVMDFSPVHLLAICRALGLCGADEIGRFAEALATGGASLDVNLSGGLAARNIDFASGLAAVAATHDALMHDSSGSPRLGLAHAASTNAAQANSVFLMRHQGGG